MATNDYLLTLDSAPALEPVTRDEAKLWAKIDGTEMDAVVDSLITIARQTIEEYLDRSLITQTWTQKVDGFAERLYLHRGPVQISGGLTPQTVAITYLDEDGASQTLSSDVYGIEHDALYPFVYLKKDQEYPDTYPEPNAVSLTYDAGYGDAASAVPEAIKLAIKILVGAWFDDPNAGMPGSVKLMLTPYFAGRLV